ncbi:aminotransferase-like domain-containing protein [Candidimonas nitroreducens]|uniref:2-aminoadipate aminotransferase n=1 Tax=Candidimonas nitroreducens TaxID=683354 RepID=A0A225M2Z5_9BURK|nr:PLP-dependent aminotransferase family protein [Candidimonas nitroreducens]OWT55714.1 2-aminoadipate aminotransferase [Candidimonas nitroreducens]
MISVEFASSYANPAGSPIRELFPYLNRPGMISFAGGYPSPSLFDAEGLQQAAQHAFADTAGSLQYGATEGSPALRQALAQLCAARGIQCDPSHLIVTTGSQQAFDLLVRVYIAPAASVYVETPAYPAAIQALRLAQARIHEVLVDEDGIDVDALQRQLEDAVPSDRPKLLYTVPTFSNPCGTLLTQSRREALVRLALKYEFLIIEDDPYGELAFSTSVPPPIYATGHVMAAADNPVVYLSSLSKTVAPALRVGWMLAPAEILRRCAIAKQTSDLCTSPLAQAVASRYLASSRYAAMVAGARDEYASRMRAMAHALRDELADTLTFFEPKGGMFVWAELARPMDMPRLFQAAVEQGVLYVPGDAFYPYEPRGQGMRLSFATPSTHEIAQGVRRLARALRLCADHRSSASR